MGKILTKVTVQMLRDPYSFFIRVVSWASKLDGILAQLQYLSCLDKSAEL